MVGHAMVIERDCPPPRFLYINLALYLVPGSYQDIVGVMPLLLRGPVFFSRSYIYHKELFTAAVELNYVFEKKIEGHRARDGRDNTN